VRQGAQRRERRAAPREIVAPLHRPSIGELGGASQISPVKLAEVRRTAELVALAEEARAQAFRDGAGAIDMAALVRLENMAARPKEV
jgi:hypothetical protein